MAGECSQGSWRRETSCLLAQRHFWNSARGLDLVQRCTPSGTQCLSPSIACPYKKRNRAHFLQPCSVTVSRCLLLSVKIMVSNAQHTPLILRWEVTPHKRYRLRAYRASTEGVVLQEIKSKHLTVTGSSLYSHKRAWKRTLLGRRGLGPSEPCHVKTY